MCFNFSLRFPGTLFIIRRIRRDTIINVHRSSYKVSIILVRCKSNADFHERFSENTQPQGHTMRTEELEQVPITSHQLTNCIIRNIKIGHIGPDGEYRYSSTLSLTSAPDGVGGYATPRLLYPWERDPATIV
jgi:hypothetical protein